MDFFRCITSLQQGDGKRKSKRYQITGCACMLMRSMAIGLGCSRMESNQLAEDPDKNERSFLGNIANAAMA